MKEGSLRRTLLTAMLLLNMLPVAARDLPFAPPKPKAKVNPIVMLPSEHETLVAQLEAGWTPGIKLEQEGLIRCRQFFGPGSNEEIMRQMVNVATYLNAPKRQNARDFMERARKETEKMVPKDKLVWNTIANTNPDDVIFEFTIKGFIDAPDEYECERVIRGEDGMHAVIYHLGNPDASEQEREKALAWVKSVRVDKHSNEAVADSKDEPRTH